MADRLPISQTVFVFSAKLFSFFIDMHLPAQLGIQRHAKVFRCLGVRYGFAIHKYRYMMTPLACLLMVGNT